MKKCFAATLFVASATLGLTAPAHADTKPFACRNAWGDQRADVDGPVLSVQDLGSKASDKGRYRIVVRDTFTGCRILDTTITACRVGQHASSVGGRFGLWNGDDPGSDNDYPYLNGGVWDCQ
jgi:hypothetical protein